MTNEQIRSKCLGFIHSISDSKRQSDQITRAELNQDFYRGHQWTEEEHSVYKSKGVEPVTINRCKPVVKSTVGMYLQNRQSLRVRPRKGATESVAQVWTEILKHSEDLATADYVYAKVFKRGCIDTESFIKLEIDERQNANGQPVFKCRALADVDTDPNAKEYDLNISSKFVIDKEWVDKEWLEAMYPGKLESFEGGNYGLMEGDAKNMTDLAAYLSGDREEINTEDEDLELLKLYRYRVRTVYWKEVVKGLLVVDTQTRMVKVITEKVAEIRRKAKETDRYKTKDVPVHVLHATKMLGGSILEDEEHPFGREITGLPMFRFSPYWDDGYAQGVLDDIISLNREENIHRTQAIKLLNQTANSGWKVGGGSEQDKAALRNFGSVEGLVIDLSKFKGRVDKIEPNTLPTGFIATGAQFEQDVKRVSGNDDATFGYDTGRTESGKAIGLKQQQNQVTSEMIFDNFYHTLTLFGKYLLDVLRENDIYTDDEIRQVVSDSSLLDERMIEKARNSLISQIGGELPEPVPISGLPPETMAMVRPEDLPMVQQQVKMGIEASMMYAKEYPQLKSSWDGVIKQEAIEMLLAELKSATVAEYGIKVTVSPSAPTERLSQFMQLDAIQEKYGIIPPDVFIDSTDLSNKEEIKARMQQQPVGV